MRTSIRILFVLALGLGSIKLYSNGGIILPVKSKLGHNDLPLKLKIIASKMISVSGITGDDINIIIDEDDMFNADAFSGHRTIRIGKGWLDLSMEVFNDYRLTYFLLAHELSHISEGHLRFIGEDHSLLAYRNDERKSDYKGVELLYNSYLGCDLAPGTLDLLSQMEGITSNFPTTHPGTLDRVANAKRACEKIVETGKLPTDLYYEQELVFDYTFIVESLRNTVTIVYNKLNTVVKGVKSWYY